MGALTEGTGLYCTSCGRRFTREAAKGGRCRCGYLICSLLPGKQNEEEEEMWDTLRGLWPELSVAEKAKLIRIAYAAHQSRNP